MNDKLIYEFWIESVLPGFRNSIKHNSAEELISVAVNRADRDAMSGGRFNEAYSEHHDEYKDSLRELISINKDDLSSDYLINMMCKGLHEGVTVGLIQKLVNMSLKYLFSVDIYDYSRNFEIVVPFEKCDCPLDSIVLERLSSLTCKKYTPWTKIDSIEYYNSVQEDIRKNVEVSNLEFDFKYWGVLRNDQN